MGIVLRNLKAGMSRWSVWCNLAPMGLFFLMVVRAVFREGGPFGRIIAFGCLFPLAFVLMWLSYQVVHAQSEVVGKAFSFCLPGYRESLRKLNGTGAVLSGLGVGLAFTVYGWVAAKSGVAVFEIILQVVGGFSAGAVCMLAIGTLRLTLSRLAWSIVMLLSPALIIGGFLTVFSAFEYPIVWFPVIAVSVTFSVFAWRRLGDMPCVRHGHRMMVEDAMEACAKVGGKKTVSPWVEDLFLGSMQRCGAQRYLLGGVYRTFGKIMSHWLLILAFIVGNALLYSYVNKLVVELAFVAFPVVLFFKPDLPVTSDILFPEGRNERYRTSVAAAVAASLLLVGAVAAVTAFSWFFAMFMPDIGGLPCEGIPLSFVYLPCLLAPTYLALQLIALGAKVIVGYVAPIVVLVITLVFFGVVLYMNHEDCTWPGYTRAVLFLSVFITGWIAFLLTSRRVCSKWYLGK